MTAPWADTCFRLKLFTASPHMRGLVYQAHRYPMSLQLTGIAQYINSVYEFARKLIAKICLKTSGNYIYQQL
jgi:hypothetical protein